MPIVDNEAKRIDARIVVYGPTGAGKTAFIQRVQAETGGEPIQVGDDPLAPHHEVLWVTLGEIKGFTTRLQLCTTAAENREDRRMFLQLVDGVVFVADATPGREADNEASLTELETILGDWGTPLSTMPIVVFANKRDLAGALAPEAIAKQLVTRGDTALTVNGGSATTGDGVMDTLKSVARLVLGHLMKKPG